MDGHLENMRRQNTHLEFLRVGERVRVMVNEYDHAAVILTVSGAGYYLCF